MATPRPAVHVVATGGSISGLGPHRLDYILYPELGQRLSIEEMLARIPEAHDIAEIQAENLIRVGSTSIGPPEWLQLAQICRETGKEHMVKVHSGEGVANHPGPEPCGGLREGTDEKSVGGHVGGTLRRENC